MLQEIKKTRRRVHTEVANMSLPVQTASLPTGPGLSKAICRETLLTHPPIQLTHPLPLSLSHTHTKHLPPPKTHQSADHLHTNHPPIHPAINSLYFHLSPTDRTPLNPTRLTGRKGRGRRFRRRSAGSSISCSPGSRRGRAGAPPGCA